MHEVGEKIASRTAIVRFLRSVPHERRRLDEVEFERRLCVEQSDLEAVLRSVFDAWVDGRVPLCRAVEILRSTASTYDR